VPAAPRGVVWISVRIPARSSIIVALVRIGNGSKILSSPIPVGLKGFRSTASVIEIIVNGSWRNTFSVAMCLLLAFFLEGVGNSTEGCVYGWAGLPTWVGSGLSAVRPAG